MLSKPTLKTASCCDVINLNKSSFNPAYVFIVTEGEMLNPLGS
jgi:hypothetical protein